MTTLVINAKSKSDLKFIAELAKKLGLYAKMLSTEEREDIALCRAIEEGLKTKKVSEKTIMKTLKKLR